MLSFIYGFKYFSVSVAISTDKLSVVKVEHDYHWQLRLEFIKARK